MNTDTTDRLTYEKVNENVKTFSNLVMIFLILRHGGLELVSGLENTLRSAERGVSRVGLVRPLCRFRRRLALNARLSSRPIAFGAGFVLTVDRDSTAVVNVAPSSGGGVVQKIFESVLNGSRYLDVSFHQVSVGNAIKPFYKLALFSLGTSVLTDQSYNIDNVKMFHSVSSIYLRFLPPLDRDFLFGNNCAIILFRASY